MATSKILRLASFPTFSLVLRVKCRNAGSFNKVQEYHNVVCTFFTTSQREFFHVCISSSKYLGGWKNSRKLLWKLLIAQIVAHLSSLLKLPRRSRPDYDHRSRQSLEVIYFDTIFFLACCESFESFLTKCIDLTAVFIGSHRKMHKSVNKSARTHFMIQGHVFLQVVNDAIHEGKNALLYSKDWIKINFILHSLRSVYSHPPLEIRQ